MMHRRFRWGLSLSLLLAPAWAVLAQSPVSGRPDHTILVTIETDPPGAEILADPQEEGLDPIRIGTSPHVAVVELRWGRGLMRKKWRKLEVWTPGDLCVAEYDRKEKRYDVAIQFIARAPGYEDARVDDLVATFVRPEELDWDNIDGLPTRQTLSVKLTPSKATAAPAPAKKAWNTVMMAASDEGQFGTLLIEADVDDADVVVNGKVAGKTPLKAVVREGVQDVVVQKAGYKSYTGQVTVGPASEIALKVSLTSP